MAQKIKILLVDDHPLVREWLTNLINQRPGFEVCGETAVRWKLYDWSSPTNRHRDCGHHAGKRLGMDLIKNIKASNFEVAVLVLSMHDELLYAERALRAGPAVTS